VIKNSSSHDWHTKRWCHKRNQCFSTTIYYGNVIKSESLFKWNVYSIVWFLFLFFSEEKKQKEQDMLRKYDFFCLTYIPQKVIGLWTDNRWWTPSKWWQ
jgi:hypothetical protein